MTKKVIRYRNKHKRCKYCKHLYLDCSGERIGVSSFYKCLAKDKIIRYIFPDMTSVPRWFCQCYELEGCECIENIETKICNSN